METKTAIPLKDILYYATNWCGKGVVHTPLPSFIHTTTLSTEVSIPDFPHGAQCDGIAHGMKAGGAEGLKGVGEGVHARPRSQCRREVLHEARVLWRGARV